MLKREFALLRTVEVPTPQETAKLQALSILLKERRVDLQALERAVMIDAEVAPTPTTDVFTARPGRTARTLDYKMDGQGPLTPEARPPDTQRGIGTPVSGDPLLGESPGPRSSDQQNDPEFRRMERQLREAQLELAAQRAQAALPPSPQLEHIMDKQTQILEAALKDRGSKRNTAGVIQVNPKVT